MEQERLIMNGIAEAPVRIIVASRDSMTSSHPRSEEKLLTFSRLIVTFCGPTPEFVAAHVIL